MIVDEVFLDYPVGEEGGADEFCGGAASGADVCLSGMSKIAGLPQMKVGWIAGFGPEGVRRRRWGGWR